jgi:hypothetical protein
MESTRDVQSYFQKALDEFKANHGPSICKGTEGSGKDGLKRGRREEGREGRKKGEKKEGKTSRKGEKKAKRRKERRGEGIGREPLTKLLDRIFRVRNLCR